MTTFEIYLFTHYTDILKLYKASDGQYFVKLKDAQAYCNLLNEKTFTEIQRPDNLPLLPDNPIPVNELWVKYPTLWQWRGDFSISGNVQLLPVPSAENRMWVYRITTTSATVSKELNWGSLSTQKLIVGVGDYIMCTSEKWEKLFNGKRLTDIEGVLSGKVDTATGKQLSTNDYSTAEKTKLEGITTGATVNATDANLRDRTTHTGTQAISTVAGLQTGLDGKLLFIVSATFSAIPAQSGANYKLILVLSDEANGNLPTIYFYDGIGLQWLPTQKLY